jgi:hypothetical protein
MLLSVAFFSPADADALAWEGSPEPMLHGNFQS